MGKDRDMKGRCRGCEHAGACPIVEAEREAGLKKKRCIYGECRGLGKQFQPHKGQEIPLHLGRRHGCIHAKCQNRPDPPEAGRGLNRKQKEGGGSGGDGRPGRVLR